MSRQNWNQTELLAAFNLYCQTPFKKLHARSAALEELRQRGVGILDVEARELTVATVNRYLDLKARAAL